MERKIDVLHVDDENQILDQTKLYLEKEKEQLEIETTDSPKKALEKLKNNSYDIVISDYKMPKMDGLELLEKVKKEIDGREDLPFIVFTGKGREEVAMKAINLGADRYLQKGGDPKSQYKMLAEIVTQVVKRKEYEERFKDFFEYLPYLAFMISPSGVVQELNESFLRTTGYEREDMVGKPMTELTYIIPEEDMEKAVQKFSKFLTEREVEPFTIKYQHKNGDIRYLEISAVKMVERSKVDRVIGVGRDITQEKEAEDREEFLHSLLRHDVRNKSQIVQGYLELMEDYDLPEEVEEYLSKARKATRDGIDIIEKVRTLRDVEEEDETRGISIRPVLKHVISENEPQATEKGINIKCQDDRCKIMGGSLLEELFSNLLENSLNHSECDEILISMEEVEDRCVITVEDDGIGISDEDKDKVLEKGFKDGETGGSGLGLYLVKEIAETYGGDVKVGDSELGGARFEVHLQKA